MQVKDKIDNRIDFFPLNRAKCIDCSLANKKLKNKVGEIKKTPSETKDEVMEAIMK